MEVKTRSGSSAADGGSMLKAASAMGAATFLSRILGLVREQVFAVMFGAGNLTDAFNVAFRIPNLLRDLFAEGAMSASLVPTFTRTRIEQGDRRAWRVAGLVFRVLLGVVGVLAFLGMLFAPQLVDLYASAFRHIPGKFELTVRMTQVMFPFFPLVALAAAFMGILNACGKFFLPAFSSALFNLASILTGVALALFFGSPVGARFGFLPIEGMAIGVLVGGVVQAFSQLPALRRAGYRWEPRAASDPVWYRDPALKSMLALMVPGMVGLAATQVNVLVNTILATSQGPGAVSWLNYSFRLMQFPIGIFGVSLAAAILPRVSRQWVEKDVAGVENTLTQGLKRVFAINLPASAGLAFLGYPIIELIFQYGRFTSEDTRATALALAMYAIGLAAYSAVKVLVPACYALGNTRAPVISSVLTVGVTVGLNLAMARPFGYWGLALGTSVGALFNFGFLTVSVRAMLEKAGATLPVGALARAFGAYTAVALAMGALCYYSHLGLRMMISDAWLTGFLGNLGLVLTRGFRVSILVMEGVVVVVLLARMLGLAEMTEAVELFAKKIKKKVRRA